jgi:soluble lytic murein transglycosylase-like protein
MPKAHPTPKSDARAGRRACALALLGLSLLLAPEVMGVTLPATCSSLRADRALGRIAPDLDAALRVRIARAIEQAAKDNRVPALLILAVMERESRFAPRARSHRGARGLMQIRPSTAAEIAGRIGVDWRGARTLHDVDVNVRLGTAYLAQMLGRFGHLETALVAYNAGPTRVARTLDGSRTLSSPYARAVTQRFFELRRSGSCGI